MRTLEEVNKEYSKAIAELGICEYDLERIPARKAELIEKIYSLHKEADEIRALEAK